MPSSERLPAGSFASDQVRIDAWFMLLRTVKSAARSAAGSTRPKTSFGTW